MESRRQIVVLVVSALIAGCGVSDGDSYTLYRTSVFSQNARMHVASFDTDEGGKYNDENCQQAQQLFQAQPGVSVRFWCEKGRYRK